MEPTYLLDTNIAIAILSNYLPFNPNSAVHVALSKQPIRLSVISEIELLGWQNGTESEIQMAAEFVEAAVVLWLDRRIADQTIEIRRQFKSIKLPDAIIAATALTHQLTLLTRNVSDFSKIPGLTVVNPFIP